MRLALAIALLLPLNACATYPELALGKAPVPVDSTAPTDVDQALAEAARLQATYSTGYVKSAKAADWSQLPIIGAAAAAAWVLLVDHRSAAKTAGKIGISAGAYTAARGQLFGAGLTDAYLAGHAAMTCVLAEGTNFSGTTAEKTHSDLDTHLQDVANQIVVVNRAARQSAQPTGADVPRLDGARTSADAAMTQALTATRIALTEEAAYNGAAPVFWNAVASISVRVASKGRVRPPIDFTSLRSSLAPEKTGEATQPTGLGTPTVDQIILNIQLTTSELIRRTLVLTSSTPPYRQSLERVAACPDQIR